MKQKKPNFIVIGAMKAATTSLYTYLKQHPEIFMTKVKEPMFFNNFNQSNNYTIIGKKSKRPTTLEEYLLMYNDVKNEKAIGEASPAYIYSEKAPALIKEYFSNVKIIAVLRQPTDRAYSNYLHTKRSDRENATSFEQAIELEPKRIQDNWSPLYHYIEKGYYSIQLKRYYQLFDKENIRIYLFEDIVNKTNEILKDIFGFLDVDIDVKIDVSKKVNVSGNPRGFFGWILKKMRYYNLMPKFAISDYFPKFIMKLIFNAVYSPSERLDNNLRKRITNKYYKKEIKSLEKLINRDLKSWLS